MANPQAENGHIDIANEIVEALARVRLSGEEVQVLWVILRKTYGWHKKEDAISLSQFSELTGLSRQHVLRAIKKLLPKMVITVSNNGNRHPNTYKFNKNFDDWKVLPKKGTPNNGYRVLPIMVTKVLPIMVHTKEKKETNKRKEFILPPDINQETWDAFVEMRTKVKAPLTDHAKRLILTKLDALAQDKNKLLNQSIENSWKGIFPLKNGSYKGDSDFV
jgi:phage replication O-like protein O